MKSNLKLGDAATFVNGYAFKPSDWNGSGYPIIRIQDLTGNAYETNYFCGLLPEKYLVKKGDILISWSASLGVYEWNKENAWLNQHIFKVVFDKVEWDKNFFKYLVSYKISEMERHVHGATMKHITKGKFDNIPIYHPPFPIQQKIAAILDNADALRKKDRQLLEKYDDLLQSIFYKMFGNPVKNEKGWDTFLFKELGSIDRGVSKNRPRNAPELLGGKYPLVQTGDVANSNGYISTYKSSYSELGLKQSKLWKAGTLCITIAANIAKTGVLTFEACFPDSIVGFIPNQKTNVEYIQWWLSHLQQTLEQTAPESAQKNINLEILRNLSVPVPPIELQNKFSEIVKNIELQKNQVRRQVENSESLFQRLLHNAFKGELIE